MSAIERLAHAVAAQPWLFHVLRKIPERNYRETKARIARVRDAVGARRVLDVGCGTGEFAPLFDAAGYVGVDVSGPYVRFARRRLPRHRFEHADVVDWRHGGDGFDLVLVNGVLHHMDDDEARAVLGVARANVRPGGTVLVIEDVPGEGPLARIVHGLDRGHHVRTPDAWRALVSEVLPIRSSEPFTSGVCPYLLLECLP